MNRTDMDVNSSTYGLWTPPPGAFVPRMCSSIVQRRPACNGSLSEPSHTAWRDECIKSMGLPISACSYFQYEEYPAFMSFFYIVHFVTTIIMFVV